MMIIFLLFSQCKHNRPTVFTIYNKLCHPQEYILLNIISFFSTDLVLYDFCLHFSVWWVKKNRIFNLFLVRGMQICFVSNLCSLIITVPANDRYRIIISHQGMGLVTVAMGTIIWITMPLAVVPAASAERAPRARPWAGHHCTKVEVLRRLLSEC